MPISTAISYRSWQVQAAENAEPWPGGWATPCMTPSRPEYRYAGALALDKFKQSFPRRNRLRLAIYIRIFRAYSRIFRVSAREKVGKFGSYYSVRLPGREINLFLGIAIKTPENTFRPSWHPSEPRYLIAPQTLISLSISRSEHRNPSRSAETLPPPLRTRFSIKYPSEPKSLKPST
jgi:hypothetical protein